MRFKNRDETPEEEPTLTTLFHTAFDQHYREIDAMSDEEYRAWKEERARRIEAGREFDRNHLPLR